MKRKTMIFDEVLDTFLSKNGQGQSFEFLYGYKNFGPFLYGFVHWLNEQLLNQDITKAYFLARDGDIIKRAFENVYPKSIVERKYLYSSRRSMIVPSFAYANSIDEIIPFVFQKRRNFKYILTQMGLEEQEIHSISKDLLETRFFSVEDVMASQEHVKILHNFFPRIKEKSTEELKFLIRYLKQEKLEGKIALIDIGWYGRIQEALEKILTKEKIDTNIMGLYIGIQPFSTVKSVKGFLFDTKKNVHYYQNTFRGAIQAFEAFFIGREGSTERFIEWNEKIAPHKEPWGLQEEKSFKKNYEIQEGALAFLRDFSKSEIQRDYNQKSADFWFRGIEKTLLKSTPLPIAKALGELQIDHGGKETKYLARPKSFGHYMAHPKEFQQDIEQMIWLSGFFTQLLKVKLPYYWLLKFLP